MTKKITVYLFTSSKDMKPPKYLQLNRAFLLFVGLWKLERKSIIYTIYRTVMISYFWQYFILQIVQLYFIIGKDNNEAFKNAGVSMMCLVTLFKAIVCTSSASEKLIQIIKSVETKITQSDNQKILEIYKYYTRYNKFVLLLFYFSGLTVTIASIISPVLEEWIFGILDKRPLPVSTWFPFDNQKYYYTAFLIQSIDSNFGCHFTVAADTFLLSLIIFAVCQLRILNYKIRKCSLQELPDIFEEHLFIIRYETVFN